MRYLHGLLSDNAHGPGTVRQKQPVIRYGDATRAWGRSQGFEGDSARLVDQDRRGTIKPTTHRARCFDHALQGVYVGHDPCGQGGNDDKLPVPLMTMSSARIIVSTPVALVVMKRTCS